ncbi:hypothetical protein V8F33_002820 [Rhypophila sp. PSN 637]
MASTLNVLVGFAAMLSLALLVAPEYASLAATYVAYLLFSAADLLAAAAPLVDVLSEYDSVVAKVAKRLVAASPLLALVCFVLIPGPLKVVLTQGAMFLRPVPVIFPVRGWIARLGHCCQDFMCLDRKSFDCLVSKLLSTKAAWNNVRTQIETTSARIRILCEQCRKVHQEWSQRQPTKAALCPPPTWNPYKLDTPKDIPAGTRPSSFWSVFRGDWRLQPLEEQINAYDECRKNAHPVLAQLQKEEERCQSLLDLFETGWALSSKPVPVISPIDRQSRVGPRPLERQFRFDSRSTFIVPESTPTPPDSPVLTITAPEAPAPEVITVDTCPVVTDEPSAAPAVVDHLPVVDVKPTAEKLAHPVIGTNVPELLSRSAYQLRYTSEMMQYQKERIDRLRRVQSERVDACLRWELENPTPVVEPKSVALRKLFRQWDRMERLRESSVQEEHAPTQVEAQPQEEVVLPRKNVQEEHAPAQVEAQLQEDVRPVEESLPVVEEEEEEEETKPVPAEPHSRRQEDEVPHLQEEVVTALPVAPEPEPLQEVETTVLEAAPAVAATAIPEEVETTVLEAAPAVAATAIPEEDEDEWEDVMDEDDEEEAADSLMSAIPEQTGGDGAGAAVLDAPPVAAFDVQSPAQPMDVEKPYQPGCAEEGAAAPAPAASWVLPQQQEFTFGLPQQQMPAFGLPQRQTFTFGQPQPQQQPSLFALPPQRVEFSFAPPALDSVQLPADFLNEFAFEEPQQQQQQQPPPQQHAELEFVPEVGFPADFNFDFGDFGMEDVQTSSGEAAPVQPAFQPMDIQHPEPQMLEVAAAATPTIFANVTHAMDIDAPSFQRDARVVDEEEARWILEAVEAARLAETPAANQQVPVPPVAQQAAVPEPVVAPQQEYGGWEEEPEERPPPFFPRPNYGHRPSSDDDDSDDGDDAMPPGAGAEASAVQPAAESEAAADTAPHVPGPRGPLKRSLDQAFDGREEKQRRIKPHALPALSPQPEEEMPEPETEDRFAGHSAEDRHWLRQMEAEMVVERDHPDRVIASCRFTGASTQLVPENWHVDDFDWNLRFANDPRDDDDVTDPDLYDSPADEEDEDEIEGSDEEDVDGGLDDEDMVSGSDDDSDMEELFGRMDEEDN